MATEESFEGRCACGHVRYRMTSPPLFVHACHCRECQRLSGSAFALNALIETDRLELLAGDTEAVAVTGTSGKSQRIHRCPLCRVALWSHYPGAGQAAAFVRVGTLDEPARLPPDIAIYTSSRLPWQPLPEGIPAVEHYYDRRERWPAASLARMDAVRRRSTPTP